MAFLFPSPPVTHQNSLTHYVPSRLMGNFKAFSGITMPRGHGDITLVLIGSETSLWPLMPVGRSVGWSFIWLGPSVCRSVCHNVKFHFPCSYRSPCFRALLALFSSDCWKIEFWWINEYIHLGDTHYCILLSIHTHLSYRPKKIGGLLM